MIYELSINGYPQGLFSSETKTREKFADIQTITVKRIASHDVAQLKMENDELKNALSRAMLILDNVALTTSKVAELLDISPCTVRDYARRGLLVLHQRSTDGRMLFKASDLLTKTAEELRRKKRRLKWNLKD